jgi:hypothetical protein
VGHSEVLKTANRIQLWYHIHNTTTRSIFPAVEPIAESDRLDHKAAKEETPAPEAAAWLDRPIQLPEPPTLKDLLIACGRHLNDPCPALPPDLPLEEFLRRCGLDLDTPANQPTAEEDTNA